MNIWDISCWCFNNLVISAHKGWIDEAVNSRHIIIYDQQYVKATTDGCLQRFIFRFHCFHVTFRNHVITGLYVWDPSNKGFIDAETQPFLGPIRHPWCQKGLETWSTSGYVGSCHLSSDHLHHANHWIFHTWGHQNSEHPVAFETNILNTTKDIFWDETLAWKYLVFQEKPIKSQQKGDGNTSMGVFPPVEKHTHSQEL